MQSDHDTLREHLLSALGMMDTTPRRLPGLEELRESQRSLEFERLCSNRMVMGAFRYGIMQQGRSNGYDNVESIIQRARLYQEDGNLEHLCDIANLAMIAFETGQHPQRHFRASDDGCHTRRLLAADH